MPRIVTITCLLVCLLSSAFGQFGSNTARRIFSGTAAPPATCNAGPVDVYVRTGGVSAGLYLCLTTNTWTGPLGSGTGTVTNTGGALTANSVVLGAGGSDTKVVGGFTTDGTGLLNLGSTGVGGSLKIFGSVSGSNTFSAAGNGTELDSTASVLSLPAGSTFQAASGSVTLTAPVNVTLQSGGTGNIILTGGHLTTNANCSAVGSAASPSVAACGAAFAGSFSCATNAVNTCTVNTTAVTANSEIFLSQREDTTTGTRLGVTCNATPSTIVADENITAVVAGTSFSFSLTQPVTNPNCYSYFLVN